MSDLKPKPYWILLGQEQKTVMISAFILWLFSFLLLYAIPKLLEQKEEKKQLEISEALFVQPNTPYQDFLWWKINLDEIEQKRQIINNNMLHSKDPYNYLYIENYLSQELKKIGLPPFHFNETHNFKNTWKNSIILNITVSDRNKISSFLENLGKNWFLWKNINIIKKGGIWSADIELIFNIK